MSTSTLPPETRGGLDPQACGILSKAPLSSEGSAASATGSSTEARGAGWWGRWGWSVALGVVAACLGFTVAGCGSPGIASDVDLPAEADRAEDGAAGAPQPLPLPLPDAGPSASAWFDAGLASDAGPNGAVGDAGAQAHDGGAATPGDAGVPATRGETARALVDAGARLVDVRSPSEYATSHLTGAVNIPLDALPSRLDELEPREEAIVVYCASGGRSSRAKGALVDAGYESVFDLGAMSNWSR